MAASTVANPSYRILCNCPYPMKETLGQRIRRYRIAAGYKQADLARHVGVSRVSVTKWENGTITNIHYEHRIKLAKALNVTLEELDGSATPSAAPQDLKAQQTPGAYAPAALPPLIQRIAEDLMQLDPEKLLEIKHWAAVERVFAEKRRQLAELQKEQGT